MADPTTAAILEQASPAQMVDLHNQLPGVRQVSRFSDRTTAQARLRLALERAEMKLARIDGQPGVFRVVPLTAASATRGEAALQKRITVLREQCPKRTGTASAARWALYRTGMTMAEYVEAAMATGVSRTKARKDIYTDRDHGYISISE